jgi:hypothetical protein
MMGTALALPVCTSVMTSNLVSVQSRQKSHRALAHHEMFAQRKVVET